MHFSFDIKMFTNQSLIVFQCYNSISVPFYKDLRVEIQKIMIEELLYFVQRLKRKIVLKRNKFNTIKSLTNDKDCLMKNIK